MSVFISILKCILCWENEYPDDRGDYSYRWPIPEPRFNESNSARNSHVVNQSNSTTRTQGHSPNYSVSPVTLSAPSYLSKAQNPKPRLCLDSWTKDPSTIKPLERSNEVSQNSKSSSPLPPTFSYKPPQSSSNLPQYSSTPSPTSSSKPSPLALPSFSKPAQSSSSSSLNVCLPPSKPPQSSSNLPQYSSTPSPTSSSKPSPLALPSFSKPAQSSSSSSLNVCLPPSKPPQSSSNLPQYSSTPSPTSSSKPSPLALPPFSKPAQSSSSFSPNVFSSSGKPTQSLSKAPPSSPEQPPKFKEFLSPVVSIEADQKGQSSYLWVKNDPLPIYAVPENFKALIKEDIVPQVLKKPLSPLTYKDYFAALLYAEDFYMEKWAEFHLKNVTLKFDKAPIYKKSNKNRCSNKSNEKVDKNFVAFKIDSVPERRPFLLSRDFVHARLSGRTVDPFKGIIHRVVKSSLVLVEFGNDFHSQHKSTHKYDISFTFNRVCLKRAHEALEAASDPLFQNFLFPNCVSRRNVVSFPDQSSAVHQILSFRGAPPFLVEGPDCVFRGELSGTGKVVQEAVVQIYKTSPKSQVLICAPTNKTCDVLIGHLMKVVPESHMFRANAAFRELDEVPEDILSLCRYNEECFTCPSLNKLKKFRVIFSTYVSSFRLYKKGISAGHFSHIFLLDASLAIEPEIILPLTNLANEDTTVIVTGSPKQNPGWIRSEIGRRNGLKISYFERLRKGSPYRSRGPMFITKVHPSV